MSAKGLSDATGMSVPEELWSDAYDLKQSFWEDVDQVNGATVSVSVTFTDGSTEEHHYKINTGKIYVPQDENGENQWNQLTRFLTPDEEQAATPFIYGYLMEKLLEMRITQVLLKQYR